MSESFEQFGGLNEDEKNQLKSFFDTNEGKGILAKRLNKIPEEVTYQETEDLYRRDPNPLFFANEIKLDETGQQSDFENIKLPPQGKSNERKAA